MPTPSNEFDNWDALQQKIIGLGEHSSRKSYYPALQQQIRELERANRALRMLSAVNQLLLHVTQESSLLEGVCKVLAEIGGYALVWVGYTESDAEKSVRVAASAGPQQAYLDNITVTWSDLPTGHGPMGTAIRTDSVVIIDDFSSDPRVTPWRDAAKRFGFASALGLPLHSGGVVYGAITLYATEPHAFSEDEIRLQTESANDLAYGINALRTRLAREAAEAALRDSEAKYSAIYQTTPDAITLIRLLDAMIMDVNPGFTTITGYTANEVVGRSFFELPIWVSRNECDYMYVYINAHPDIDNYQFRILNKERNIRYVTISIRIIEIGSEKYALGVSHDITEQREIEEALRQSEERYRLTFEIAPVGIVNTELDGRYTKVNQQFCDILGYSSTELTSMSFQQITHPDDLAISLQITQEMLSGKVNHQSIEKRYIRKNGDVVWGNLTISLWRDDTGQPQYFVAVVEDITQHKRLEEAIHELIVTASGLVGTAFFIRMVQALARLIPAHQILIGELLPDGKHIRTLAFMQQGTIQDNFTYELAGTPCANVMLKGVCTYTDHVADLFPHDKELQSQQIRGYLGIPLLNTQRQPIGVLACLYQQPIDNQEFAQTIIKLFAPRTAAEIERLHAEAALRTSEERYRVLTETSTVGIWQTDRDGYTMYANPMMLDMLEITDIREIAQKPLFDFFSPETVDRVRQEYAQRTAGDISRYEAVLVGMHGTSRDVLVTGAPIISPQGEYDCTIGTLTDITALKEAAKAKDQFLMILSHELKTPLTSILGWTQVAKSVPSAISQALEIIERNAFDQKRLLEDLLDVSRIITGRMAITRQPEEFWPIVQESLATMEPVAAEHGISLVINPPYGELPIDADAGRLKQVVRNLLDNALKFTPSGGKVTVTVERKDDWAILTVQDTGRGIAAEDLPKLFTPFQQISRTEEIGGLGLGLVLIRGIVQAHHGKVTAESPGIGKGSTFRVWLPLRPTRAE